jgi:hypothetical protein
MSRAFVAATVFFLVPGLLVASPAAHGQEVNCWSRERPSWAPTGTTCWSEPRAPT